MYLSLENKYDLWQQNIFINLLINANTFLLADFVLINKGLLQFFCQYGYYYPLLNRYIYIYLAWWSLGKGHLTCNLYFTNSSATLWIALLYFSLGHKNLPVFAQWTHDWFLLHQLQSINNLRFAFYENWNASNDVCTENYNNFSYYAIWPFAAMLI